MKTFQARWLSVLLVGVFVTLNLYSVQAQQETEATRDIKRKYASFEGQRPPRTGHQTGRKRPARPTAGGALASPSGALVGVTVWRMRPAANQSHPYQENSPVVGGMIAERLSANDKLAPGDRVRFTVEAPVEGYLYVVSREQYADGTSGEPYLLLPAQRIRQGQNRVEPGLLVGIPALTDNPPFFTLERSRPDHAAEAVSILFVTQPLKGISAFNANLPLNPAQYAIWKRFEAPTTRLEGLTAERPAYTKQEFEAERDQVGLRRLKQGDPLPQTLYQASGNRDGLVVTIPLPVAK